MGYCYVLINIDIRAEYWCNVFYCSCWCIVRFYIIYMDWINWIENAALLYCNAITRYWKPNTVWPFLVQHQEDDRYTKCTEYLHTIFRQCCLCVYHSSVTNICGIIIGKNLKIKINGIILNIHVQICNKYKIFCIQIST